MLNAVKLVAGIYMIALAVVVAGHLLATQVYDAGLSGTALTVWRVLDPLMVVGVVMALIVAACRKRCVCNDMTDKSVNREWLEANFTFYFSGALLLALLWNWFGVEWSNPVTADALLWVIIDSTLPFLLGSTSLRLIREATAKPE